MKDSYDVAVVGLGRLGLPYSAVLAGAGYQVIGVDRDSERVRTVNEGKAPFHEPGLDRLLDQVDDRLVATTDLVNAVSRVSVVFVLVATPSESDGHFSLSQVLPVVEQIGAAVCNLSVKPLLVINSTLTPGSMAGPVRRTLEKFVGGSVPQDIGLCYLPELVAVGQIVHDFHQPDLVIIGSFCSTDATRLEQTLASVHQNAPAVHRLDPTGAELAKLAINNYVAGKITFANHIALLGKKLGVTDVNAVTKVIGSDSRVGHQFLKPGAPFGGPCFPRDVRAMSRLCEEAGVSAVISRSVEILNTQLLEELANAATSAVYPGERIAVLGLEFKPGTGVTIGSPAVEIARKLSRTSKPLIYDPYLDTQTIEALGLDADIVTTLEEIVELASVLILPNRDLSLTLDLNHQLGDRFDRTVIDPWQLMPESGVPHQPS